MSKQSVKGHTFAARKGLAPAIISVSEVTGVYAQYAKRVNAAVWALDYEFTTYGRYRVRSARNPWRPREPRTAHLYPAGATYWEDTRGETGFRHSAWVTFTGGEAAGLDRLVVPEAGYARFVDTGEEMGRLLRQAALAGQQRGESGFWQAQSLLMAALDMLFAARRVGRESYRIGAPASPTEPDFVQRVQRFLRERLSERVTLADIAHHLRVSVSTLSHRYKRECGETPIETLARLRIAHARALLDRGLPLKAIAARLGFADAFHLSKTFKRLEGVSPRQYVARGG